MRISDWSSDVCSSDLIEPDWSQRELLAREREALGFYLSGHPIEAYGEITDQVCSGRLHELIRQHATPQPVAANGKPIWQPRVKVMFAAWVADVQIGRASCRERVCQYVYISVVAVSLNKNTENKIRKTTQQ